MAGYEIDGGRVVYLESWGASVFRVSMRLPQGRVMISSLRPEEAGVTGEVDEADLWPALDLWHGKKMLAGKVIMASPQRDRDGWLVVLAKVGDEFATGVLEGDDWFADRPEWSAGRWVRDLPTAIGHLRERSGWPRA